jgi:hypothetical protein
MDKPNMTIECKSSKAAKELCWLCEHYPAATLGLLSLLLSLLKAKSDHLSATILFFYPLVL